MQKQHKNDPMTIDLHETYMRLALAEAEKALDRREFPVGCIIADNEGVICSGSRNKSIENNELEHAEITALRKLYTKHQQRISSELVVYSTMEPCLMCYSTLIVNSIRTVVYSYEDVMGGGTGLDLNSLPPLYSSMEIKVISHVLRQDSLRLFHRFFADKENRYLQGTLLARYTCKQGEKIKD